MLYELIHLIPGAADSPLRIFRYITFRSGMAFITAWLVVMLVMPAFIRLMRTRGFGQPIRDDGPATHAEKKNTPTAGGVVIAFGLLAAALLWVRPTWYAGLTLFVFVVHAGVGLLDDYLKISGRNAKGLSGRWKLVGQTASAALAAAVWLWWLDGNRDLSVPFVWKPVLYAVPAALYLVFVAFTIVGASNAVNLTDGLDGLVTGPLIAANLGMAALAYVGSRVDTSVYLGLIHTPAAVELTPLCAAAAGACTGFLWFNAKPAEVFMGDVGALGLGGFLGTVAVLTKNELLLGVMCGLFVLEAMSVIVQVFSFQMWGVRPLKMAPFHHHLEKLGWPESKVVVRLWIVAALFTGLALASLKLRFNVGG